MCLNVRRFPPSFFPYLRTALHGAETREEGWTRCQRALAAEWDRGAEEIGQQEVAETAGGCPKRWCWSKRRTGGTEDSLPCSWVEEGWLSSEEERRSRPRSPGGRSLLPSAMFGEEQGTGDSLPAALDRRSHRRPPGGGGASGRPPERSSTIACTASEPLSWLRTERQCVREPDRDFYFFFLSPLSRRCHSSSFRLLSLASSVLTPRYAAARPNGLPPGEGEGGSRAQSREYPPACEGAMGVCDEWGGAESRWERSEAGGVNDNERHLRHSPVSSPTEELRKDKRRSDNSGRRERTRPGILVVFCVRQSTVRGCRFSFVFVYLIKCV